jgi:hypothetical protein
MFYVNEGMGSSTAMRMNTLSVQSQRWNSLNIIFLFLQVKTGQSPHGGYFVGEDRREEVGGDFQNLRADSDC